MNGFPEICNIDSPFSKMDESNVLVQSTAQSSTVFFINLCKLACAVEPIMSVRGSALIGRYVKGFAAADANMQISKKVSKYIFLC